MSQKTFIAWSEDSEDGTAHRELAQGFDYDAVERGLGTVEAMEAGYDRYESGQAMLSRLISVCAEGVDKVKRSQRRSSTIGTRFMCAAMYLRSRQLDKHSVREMAVLLGVNEKTLFRVFRTVKRKLISV